MPHIPTILTSFADDHSAHLPLLEREANSIQEKLAPLVQKKFIEVKNASGLTLKKLQKLITELHQDLLLFHYGGHANDTILVLEDGKAYREGLASILGSLPKLRLVFLNGCSTKGFVELLLQNGVKAVIATSVPIADKTAVAFSEAFYQALANKYSIRHAFEFAKNALHTIFENPPEISIHRGVIKKAKLPASDCPWQFYVQEEAADDLMAWQLPYYQNVSIIPKGFIKEKKANSNLLYVLGEMCRFNPDISTHLTSFIKGIETKKDTSTYLDVIIQNFPWIIGSQIHLLHVLEHRKFNALRLEHLLSCYIISTQLIYYILLANCWDLRRKKQFQFPKNFLKTHTLKKAEVLNKDFLKAAASLMDLINKADKGCFLPELHPFFEDFNNENSDLNKAYKYLELVRKSFKTVDKNFEKTCLNTEISLSIILQKIAFLTNYKILTVRGIQIDNPPSKKLEYELEMGELNGTKSESLRLYDDPEFRRRDDYAQSKSIILVANQQEIGHFINLSPFIIDYHTFLKEENLEPHIYAYEEDRTYYYYALKHSIFRSLKNEKGTGLIHTKLKVKHHENGEDRQELDALTADLDFSEFEEKHHLPENEEPILALMEDQFERLKTDFLVP